MASATPRDHRDQRREDDGVVAGSHLGQRFEVVGHWPRPRPGRRLGPSVDDVEPGIADQRRKERAHIGMAGIGHRERMPVDPSRRRDRLLGHHPAAGPHRAGHAHQDGERVDDVEQDEPAEREIDRLGQREVFARLGERQHLGVGGGGAATSSRAAGSESTA